MKSTIVIGHKNPDTDSICSAICYAYLKHRLTGEEHVPCRAGEINGETKYVLDMFRVPAPQLLESLEPTVADVPFRRIKSIDSTLSLKRAWEYMRDENIQTVPILTKRGKIKGLLTLGDQARFYMEDRDAAALSKAKTPFSNIADTLQGEVVVGDPDAKFTKGKVVVAAANPELMEEYISQRDMVILVNRSDTQLCAIEQGASCLIVCLGAKISPSIMKIAEDAGCTIITSPLDTYTAAKLINQSVPVSHLMRKNDIITFGLDDAVADVKATVSKLRIRYFPVLDGDDHYVGMISQRNLLDVDRRRVILVDHNEKGQAVDGIRSAEVTEIIDHHRIDSVETMNPIYFRNQPVGCTATIVTQMYREEGVDIPPQIAGLLCSAILSDTLMFRSPTCTKVDELTARELAKISGIDIEKHATEMFNAGSCLSQKTPDEIFHTDCKPFNAGNFTFKVSQVTSVSNDELKRLAEIMPPYLRGHLREENADMLLMMLTNIIDETTELLFAGKDAREIISRAFSKECGESSVVLKGVVSRKKQIIAPVVSAIGELK